MAGQHQGQDVRLSPAPTFFLWLLCNCESKALSEVVSRSKRNSWFFTRWLWNDSLVRNLLSDTIIAGVWVYISTLMEWCMMSLHICTFVLHWCGMKLFSLKTCLRIRLFCCTLSWMRTLRHLQRIWYRILQDVCDPPSHSTTWFMVISYI